MLVARGAPIRLLLPYRPNKEKKKKKKKKKALVVVACHHVHGWRLHFLKYAPGHRLRLFQTNSTSPPHNRKTYPNPVFFRPRKGAEVRWLLGFCPTPVFFRPRCGHSHCLQSEERWRLMSPEHPTRESGHRGAAEQTARWCVCAS